MFYSFRVIQKSHVDTKMFNVHHKSQKRFCVIFIAIPQHQKGYLIYVPITRKIVSSHDVLFYKTFYSLLSYMSCLYSEELSMRPPVSYLLHNKSFHERTGDILTFAHFVEENLVEN